jgi:hypothetical protein
MSTQIETKWLIILLLLMFPAAACAIPVIGGGAPPAPPTPLGDTLTLLVPIYNINLEAGQTIPGTRLTYLRENNGVYEVTIDGLQANKRSGDSFSWKGVIAPGVIGAYNLRLTTTLFGRLVAAGPINVTIFNPEPVPGAGDHGASSEALYFNNIAVEYTIPQGRIIPGTNLIFQRVIEPTDSAQGVSPPMVELSGSAGYPYFALGDSLVWAGRLRENVWIRYSLRIVHIDDNGLRIGGTAELWVDQ